MSAALSWSNRVPGAAAIGVTTGAAAGSTAFDSLAFDSAYPASNLVGTRGPRPDALTRVDYDAGASGTCELYIQVNWTTSATVRAVGVRNMRLPSTVVGVRFEVLDASGISLETTTQVLAAELEPIPGTEDRYDLAAILTADRSAARLRLRVQVAAASTGYVEAGVLWAGPAVVFAEGFNRGWSLDTVDDSAVSRSRSRGFAASVSPTGVALQIDRSNLSYLSALGGPGASSIRKFALEAGVSTPVLAIVREDTPHALQVLAIYGLITTMPRITNAPGNRYSTGLVIDKIR